MARAIIAQAIGDVHEKEDELQSRISSLYEKQVKHLFIVHQEGEEPTMHHDSLLHAVSTIGGVAPEHIPQGDIQELIKRYGAGSCVHAQLFL